MDDGRFECSFGSPGELPEEHPNRQQDLHPPELFFLLHSISKPPSFQVLPHEHFPGILLPLPQKAPTREGHLHVPVSIPFSRGYFGNKCKLLALSGILIFLYFCCRGDRAFCSVECRCKQICMDEESGRRDNCSLAAATGAGAPAARHRGRVAGKGRAVARSFAC